MVLILLLLFAFPVYAQWEYLGNGCSCDIFNNGTSIFDVMVDYMFEENNLEVVAHIQVDCTKRQMWMVRGCVVNGSQYVEIEQTDDLVSILLDDSLFDRICNIIKKA